MRQFDKQRQDLVRLINREIRTGRTTQVNGRRRRACNVPGTLEAGKIAMWNAELARLNALADDGLPLSDIDPNTGWMYGEVGA